MKKFLLLSLVIVLLITSCDMFGGKEDNSLPAEFAKINLDGASAVVLQSKDSKGSILDLVQKDLLKFVNNELKGVDLLDANGKPVTGWGTPTSIINLNEDYFVLTFAQIGNNYPPYVLVSVKNGTMICLNHMGAGHSRMDNLVSNKFINTEDASNYIYWSAPSGDATGFLNGSNLKRYNKNTGAIDSLKVTADRIQYAIALGRENDKDVVMFYPTKNAYSTVDHTYPEITSYKGYVFVDGVEAGSFTMSNAPHFGFFYNGSFYITDNTGVKAVDLTGTLSSSYLVQSQNLEGCTNIVEGTDTCLLYDLQPGSSNLFLFKTDGSVINPNCRMNSLAPIFFEDGCYYIAGRSVDTVTETTEIKKFDPSLCSQQQIEGGFTTLSSTTTYRVSSFFKDGDDFQFVGRKGSKYAAGKVTSEGFTEITSTEKVLESITKISK